MDQASAEKMLKMMQSEMDSDAVMGLRGLQGLFQSEGVDFTQAVLFAIKNADQLRGAVTIDQKPKERAPVQVTGMPQCRVPKAGAIEIIPPGKTGGDVVLLQGAAAVAAEEIAFNMKDALVAAVINKSRFKLKILDVKNARGEVIEATLQAEYERAGMTPIRVWVNVKGEVAALASILRKAVANSMPDLVAA